ncbi:50S ribosomal protein L31 [Patescibacteria group bacterium]|nr:50S ribosomal protein L31 [Patescibacteria group bacterium]
MHPEYHEECTITCACGNNFMVGSTKKEIRIELCNMCHPFYTGKQKFVDTARRVEKFQEKLTRIKAVADTRKGKKTKHAVRAKKQEEKGVGAESAKKVLSKKKVAKKATKIK